MKFFSKKPKKTNEVIKTKSEDSIITNLKSLKVSSIFKGYLPEKMINSKIVLNGKNNILYCEKDIKLFNCNIVFSGNNSIVYLSENKNNYIVDIYIHNNQVCYIGSDNYFNDKTTIILSEEKNIFIGNNGLFSKNIWIRNADPHLIYDSNSKKRINLSKSIYIGDHVWLGQNVLLLKGTEIVAGSIIAANSVIPNKIISSNTVWGGNPAKKLKEEIFWCGDCVHKWIEFETNSNMVRDTDEFIFKENKNNISFNSIEIKLLELKECELKLKFLKEITKEKDRFYIK